MSQSPISDIPFAGNASGFHKIYCFALVLTHSTRDQTLPGSILQMRMPRGWHVRDINSVLPKCRSIPLFRRPRFALEDFPNRQLGCAIINRGSLIHTDLKLLFETVNPCKQPYSMSLRSIGNNVGPVDVTWFRYRLHKVLDRRTHLFFISFHFRYLRVTLARPLSK